MSEHDHGFSLKKTFWTLFILTALEVVWGYTIPYDIKWLLWGGLLIFAFWKGLIIFMYFMHMKFEGWICKALIAPTPIMVLIIIFALTPDIASNDDLIHGVGDQLDPETGEIAEIGKGSRAVEQGLAAEH